MLAIACGIVTGHGLRESARAALIARAFAELSVRHRGNSP